MINSMDLDRKAGKMGIVLIEESFSRERKMVRVDSSGKTAASTKETSEMAFSRATASTISLI